MSFLEDMTLVQLRELAKEKSLANYSKMKKSELIESLSIQNNIDIQECRQEENKENDSAKSVVSDLALVENTKKQGELISSVYCKNTLFLLYKQISFCFS